MTKLLDKFGLIIEHSKTETFHFNRLHGMFNLPPLDLSTIGGPVLHPKNSWKYLGFIFDRKLTFHQYIDHYLNKAISTVKCMKLLGNSLWGINPIQKHLLYRCCVLPLLYTVFNYGFITKLPYCTTWKSWGKYREEPLFGYWEPSKHRLWKVLKLLWVSSLSNFTSKNLQTDLNYALLCFQRVIS